MSKHFVCMLYSLIEQLIRKMKLIYWVVFFALLPLPTQPDDCAEGCICIKDILECSGKGFTYFPKFPKMLRLATTRLMLRGSPKLDLTGVDFNKDWPYLQSIDLTGGIIFIFIYIYIYIYLF